MSPFQAKLRHSLGRQVRHGMGTRGLAGCTVRAVADASPLTKSAVHYYFETIEEIIDAAMAGLLADFLDHLRTANSTHTNARARLTAVIEQYLGAFATQPGYATLWLGYFVTSAQAGRLGRLITTQNTIIELLEDVLRGAGARTSLGTLPRALQLPHRHRPAPSARAPTPRATPPRDRKPARPQAHPTTRSRRPDPGQQPRRAALTRQLVRSTEFVLPPLVRRRAHFSNRVIPALAANAVGRALGLVHLPLPAIARVRPAGHPRNQAGKQDNPHSDRRP